MIYLTLKKRFTTHIASEETTTVKNKTKIRKPHPIGNLLPDEQARERPAVLASTSGVVTSYHIHKIINPA